MNKLRKLYFILMIHLLKGLLVFVNLFQKLINKILKVNIKMKKAAQRLQN